MRARRLIDGASFGPETVKAMGQAFDQAWAEIAGNFGTFPVAVENARLKLAEAMLSVATEDSTDVAALKAGALHAMTLRSSNRPTVRPITLSPRAPQQEWLAQFHFLTLNSTSNGRLPTVKLALRASRSRITQACASPRSWCLRTPRRPERHNVHGRQWL